MHGILHRCPQTKGDSLTLLPWEYFWIGFNKINFPDLFDPLWMGSGILLIVLIALYVMRTRALHRHRLYLDMWEWLFWTGLITYFLLIVARASEWRITPSTPVVPGGPIARRCPTPNRRISTIRPFERSGAARPAST